MSSGAGNRWQVTERSATSLAREASGRDDVVVRIGAPAPDAAVHGSDPDVDVIHVDAAAAGLQDEGRIVLVDSLISRLQAPVVAGLVLAGAARAAHSRWVYRIPHGTAPGVVAVAWQLDRARAKKRLVTRRPQDRLFLRAAAAAEHGVGPANAPAGDVRLRTALDVLPEAECGVLPRWLGVELRRHLEDALGADVMERAAEIWRDVQLVADDDATPMLALAERWLELFPPGEDEDGPGSVAVAMLIDGVNEMLAEVAGDTAVEAACEVADLAGKPRSAQERDDAAEDDHTSTEAGYTFGPTSRKPIAHRNPTATDFADRSAIVRRLRRAQYRAPHKVGVPVGYPTGRARGDALVQRAAQQAQGVAVTALPWKQRRWRTAPRPPILAGIVVDLSGSMNAWLPSAGTAMWAVAAAVSELGGRAAAAGFAGDVFPLLRPGAQPTRVPVLSNRGGSDKCADAMAAVTGGAQLTQPGAAVMVVLTDSDLPDSDRAPIDRHAHYLARNDVHLIWALTESRSARSVVPEAAVVIENVTPTTFPTLVADAIADALAR